MKIIAHGGDALSTPANTLKSYWAALALGADGIVVNLAKTSDQHLVCATDSSLETSQGQAVNITKCSLADILELDAGSQFHSTALDSEYQPAENTGADRPWVSQKHYDRQGVPTLNSVLQWFARRTQVILQLPENVDETFFHAVINAVEQFGCLNHCLIQLSFDNALNYIVEERIKKRTLINVENAEQVNNSVKAGFTHLLVNYEQLNETLLQSLAQLNANTSVWLSSSTMPYGLTPDAFSSAIKTPHLAGFIFKSVSPSRELLQGKALVLSDDFKGAEINRDIWSAGYSHQNQDTVIKQNEKLIISIKDDGSYSGAGAVSQLSLYGDYDAQVDFYVKTPQQGTTLEMAAITHDPGYFNIDNTELNSRSVNLTFDVHGAPPYASSECDEDDGFRCGWNNGFNLTKISENYSASSVNMYNKYGRDVGPKAQDGTTGTLRLVRHDSYYATFYQDKTNGAWVCSGSMLVNNMSKDNRIRLAAKHWSKQRKNGKPYAPGNEVHFSNFKVFQYN